MSDPGPQRETDEHFDRHSDYWRDVYAGGDIESVVYHERMATALGWLDELDVPAHATALDLGCGAGLVTVELAARGLQVTACDSSPEMVRQTQETVDARQIGQNVRVLRADAHELPFADASSRVVVSLGLIPWLREPQLAVNEIARVLEPGGWVILTADNALRLNALTDPSQNLLLAPVQPVYRALERRRRGAAGMKNAPFYRHRPAQVRRMLLDAGLQPMRETTVGFGPFTFMGRRLLSDPSAKSLNRTLEGWARRHPRLRRHGWHHVLAARRPD